MNAWTREASASARGTAGGGLIVTIVLIWLAIGVIAAGQRHYLTRPSETCSRSVTLAATVLVGPLNYLGVDPQISCGSLPQPST